MAGRSLEPAARELRLWRTRVFLWAEDALSRPNVITWLGVLVLWGMLLVETLPTLLAHAAPPGADPGNWLDLAWSLTGQGARLTDWAYPPLSLVILRGFLVILPPLAALKALGLLSWGLMSAAVWIVLDRSLPRLPAAVKLGIAALCTLAGYNAEMLAWGGYPQLLGTAFLVVSLPALETTLHTGSRRAGIIAAIASFGVIITHHLLAAALPFFWLIVFAWVALQSPGSRGLVWSRFWKLALFTTLISLLALPVYVEYVSLLAGNPANSSGFSLQSIPALIDYVYRGLAPLWLAVLLPVMLTPFLMRDSRLSGTVLAFTWGTLLIFLALWEVRYLQILFIGIAFGLGILFEQAWNHRSSFRFTWIRQSALIVLLALALLASVSQSQSEFVLAANFYTVADDQVLPGIQWLAGHSLPGERVTVSQVHLNHLDWWIAGLAHRPTLAATDPRWLSFKDERVYAAAAEEIFNPHTSPERIRELLLANHIEWVFIDKQGESNNLSPLIKDGTLVSGYEDQRVLILRVLLNRAAGLTS
jgi:hypothetical protein